MSCYCGDKDCPECSPEAKKRWRNDDSNMGHESVPYKSKHKTMAYSIVDETEVKKRHGGSAALAPTELMPTITPLKDVKTLISLIIERDLLAWKALPVSIRDLMLASPNKFFLHIFEGAVMHDQVPDIFYNGVRMRWSNNIWTVHSIEVV